MFILCFTGLVEGVVCVVTELKSNSRKTQMLNIVKVHMHLDKHPDNMRIQEYLGPKTLPQL